MVQPQAICQPTIDHSQRRRLRRRAAVIAAPIVIAAALSPLQPAQAAQAAQAPHTKFVPGTATATSQALQISPRTGGLAATVTVGAAVADYRGSLAQASSQTADLGLIGTDATVQCDANPPLLKPDQLPQPLVAESDHGNAQATKTTAGSGNSGVVAVAGQESVRATTLPQSTASFDGSQFVVPGLLTAAGLQSHSHARLISGTARIASSTAHVGSIRLAGGKVVLSGLQWSAGRRTGSKPGRHASFTVGAIRLAGHSLPVRGPSIEASLATINKALKPTGVHVSMPARTYAHGKIAISPLSVGIDDSKIGGETINPVLQAVQPVTDKLSALITGFDCRLGNVLTLADLALSAVDGTGGLDIRFGGATADNNDKAYGNPFGAPPLHHQLGQSSPGGHTPARPGTPGTTTTTASGGHAGNAAAGNQSPATESAAASTSAHCSTTSPADWPSCTRGRGLAVGLAALGLLAAFAATDFFVLRRRRAAVDE
jgi:hypothetical protein